ncbi:MAG TPA: L-aspartate oxidase [Acidobacteriaceae bacterium]|nr:L-aspartate oxidase [Acidobacteriaceae bacterium]
MRGWTVVGGGITGLRAALTLAKAADVTLITKESASESNTHYAQGGIAVAMGGHEDIELHGQDTIQAGDGLVFEKAARLLVEEGPARIEELLAWGTHFDREKQGQGELMRTREGAHSLPRILHANGDATGREIGRALLERVAQEPRIHLHERVTMRDLVVSDGRVIGVEALDEHNRQLTFLGGGVLLASGGAGQVYSDTTNPGVATGDGIAVAYRAGAEVADMEFYQFHPTALSLPGAPRFLLSEALRGEGAVLRNHRGERFMDRYHPMAELAPRDIVARAIMREGVDERSGETMPVYLDMRHVTGKDLHTRFPGISARLAEYNFDLSRDLIPIRPAAHYLMGGVRTDLHGRTTLPGLFAAGEVACTGVHGANRLASNSLLEGLVFGQRAAEAMLQEGLGAEPAVAPEETSSRAPEISDTQAEAARVAELRERLRALMWKYAGLLRDESGLMTIQAELQRMRRQLPAPTTRENAELRNLHAVAELIVASALARKESRGAHARTDFPQHDPGTTRHSRMVQGHVDFVEFR